jgi:hypothetical protein
MRSIAPGLGQDRPGWLLALRPAEQLRRRGSATLFLFPSTPQRTRRLRRQPRRQTSRKCR